MYRAFAITSKLSVPLQTNGVGIDGARILAILLIVLGLSAISIGLSIYLTGAPHTGEITTQLYDHLTRMPHGSVPLDGPTVDSELQFFAPFWMAYGAMLMIIGFLRRSSFVRWQALILIAATTIKVFVYDVSQLDRGYRIVSFIVLGALLLAISFVYQRDWLNLRKAEHRTT